jgi:hypothetical protein|nr:MAG TPA: hypothetical protein [Caudoviricetes sp.]
MKKIYKVILTQGFNAHKREQTSFMDIFLNRTRYENKICYHHVTGREKYIYTESEKQAKLLYEKRYPVSKIDNIINSFYGSWGDEHERFELYKENPCFSYSLDTEVVENMTLNEMKNYLTADDFLEYCKDHLYPINVVIDGE